MFSKFGVSSFISASALLYCSIIHLHEKTGLAYLFIMNNNTEDINTNTFAIHFFLLTSLFLAAPQLLRLFLVLGTLPNGSMVVAPAAERC